MSLAKEEVAMHEKKTAKAQAKIATPRSIRTRSSKITTPPVIRMPTATHNALGFTKRRPNNPESRSKAGVASAHGPAHTPNHREVITIKSNTLLSVNSDS